MFFLLACAAGAVPALHDHCDMQSASVARYTDGSTQASATDYVQAAAHTAVRCTSPHCNNVNPAVGLACTPLTRQCAMCADPDLALIGNNYTVIIRPQCASTAPCYAATIPLAGGLLVQHRESITITSDFTGALAVAACPLFTFNGLQSVTLHGLVIDCATTSTPATAPAILFTGSASLLLQLSHITAYQAVLSAVLVVGGRFDLVPPTPSTALAGTADTVGVPNSTYGDPVSLTLTDVGGRFDTSKLVQFTRVIITPAEANVLSPTDHLDVTDMSLFTNIFGRVYNTILHTRGDLFGYTQQDENDSLNGLIYYINIVNLAVFSILIFVGQDIIGLSATVSDAKLLRLQRLEDGRPRP